MANGKFQEDLIIAFFLNNLKRGSSTGKLVKMLLHTTVTKYLEWKCVDGSYVFQVTKGGVFSKSKNVIKKVPGNDSEALKSDLMGLFEKKRCRNFFIFVQNFSEEDKSTWKDFNVHA